MTNIREILIKAGRAGRNVLLEGRYGMGKSSLILSVAQELGFSVKYFSAPTLDPFADLVGIPVPILEEEPKRIIYLRPGCVNEAELFFFDELNRASAKVLNAVFELVQYRSINGERLPKLRAVFAAINPAENDSHIQELDAALLDRFHIYLKLDDGPDRQWFVKEFGDKLGSALLSWYESDLDEQSRRSLSNRRLEYIGRCFLDGIGPRCALPPQSKLPIHLLEARINGDANVLTIEDFVGCPKEFSQLVASNLNVAIRFGCLMPMMGAKDLAEVPEVILALPTEVLTMLWKRHPSVFTAAHRAVVKLKSLSEGSTFANALRQRLAIAEGTPVAPGPTLNA